MLHHVEINVSDLERSAAFWEWLLVEELGWLPFQRWPGGRSWSLGATYLVLVETGERFRADGYHRSRIGLNHVALHAASREHVDAVTATLRARGARVLYEDRHPFAGGPGHYAVFFEDPDRIKVELVAPPG